MKTQFDINNEIYQTIRRAIGYATVDMPALQDFFGANAIMQNAAFHQSRRMLREVLLKSANADKGVNVNER